MTLVHASPPLLPARPDDSAALRRRLLQDLERQWLEAWGQAHPQAAQPGPAPEADEAARAPSSASHAEVGEQAPPASAGPSPARWENPPASSRGDDSDAELHRDTARPGQAPGRHEPTRSRESSSPSPTAAEAATAVPPGGSAREPTIDSGLPQRSSKGQDPAVLRSLPGNEAASPNVALAGAVALAGPGMAAAAGMPALAGLQGGGMPPQQAPMPAAAPVQAIGLQEPVPAAGLPAPDGSADEQAAAGAPGRSTAAPAETREAQQMGPRHLMLRELDEHEVLASMRDVQLSSAESLLAAQGLARALMQAGYARVQVVVNGRQHQHEATDGDGLPDAGAEAQPPAAACILASPSGVRHGH